LTVLLGPVVGSGALDAAEGGGFGVATTTRGPRDSIRRQRNALGERAAVEITLVIRVALAADPPGRRPRSRRR
jgi:hypothetical protein